MTGRDHAIAHHSGGDLCNRVTACIAFHAYRGKAHRRGLQHNMPNAWAALFDMLAQYAVKQHCPATAHEAMQSS